MQMTQKPLIIIPAYNEQDNIVATVKAVADAGYDYVVINDGSTDETLQACIDSGLNVVDLGCNLGIGGAVQTGHKYAQAHGYEIDIQFDGDGQHDARFIPALIEAVDQGVDLVVGSRFVDRGSSAFKSTALRRAGIKWLSVLIKGITGNEVKDPTSGFRACGPKAIKLYCDQYPSDYPEPESLVTASKSGCTIKEIPVSMNERQGGASSISPLRSVYYMIKVTLAILISGFTK